MSCMPPTRLTGGAAKHGFVESKKRRVIVRSFTEGALEVCADASSSIATSSPAARWSVSAFPCGHSLLGSVVVRHAEVSDTKDSRSSVPATCQFFVEDVLTQ